MLAFFLSTTFRQDVPKIEDLLKGPNSTYAESEENWRPIGQFLATKIESVAKKNLEDVWKVVANSGLRSNDQASFGAQVLKVSASQDGYIVYLTVTSRANPERLSRHASILYLWEQGRLRTHFLGRAMLLKDGALTDGSGILKGSRLVVGGTNWRKPGEAGYGPAAAIVLEKKGRRWSKISEQEFGGSGRAEPTAKGLHVVLFTGHNDVLKSHYQSPTMAKDADAAWDGKKFRLGKVTEVHNGYWAVSEFIRALRKNDRKSAERLVASPDFVDKAIAAGAAKPGIVWQAIEGGTGSQWGLQLNHTFPDGVWYSFSFWFKQHGEMNPKIIGIDQYQPKPKA